MDKKISQLDPAAALDGTELLAVVQGGSTLKSAVSTVKTYLDGYYVPLARTLTINGTSYDLTANRTWNIDTLPAQAGNNGKFLTTDGSTASWGTITQPVWGSITGTLSNQTDLVTYVDDNLYKKGGNSFGANVELGTNDAYSLAFRTNNTARITISSTGETGIMVAPSTDARLTIGNGSTTRASLRLMSGSLLTSPISGAIENDGTNLYYTDNTPTRYALLTTATGVTGSGTTNYVPKWTSSNVLGNSLIFDNGTNVGINQSSPSARLHVVSTSGSTDVFKAQSQYGTSLVVNEYGRVIVDNGLHIGSSNGLSFGSSAPFSNVIITPNNWQFNLGNTIILNDGGYATHFASDSATLFHNPNRIWRWVDTNITTSYMTLTSVGLGVGDNLLTPTAKLHAKGSTSAAGAYALKIENSSNSPLFCVQNDGTVAIGTNAPNTSSILDIVSTTQGVLLPRMTTAQRDAISTPANGLEIYNTSTTSPNYYDGTTWQQVTNKSYVDVNIVSAQVPAKLFNYYNFI